MCWFRKKKPQAAFEDTTLFLEEYAGNIKALLNYAKENEKVSREINRVKEAYIYAVAPKLYNKKIQQYRENIVKIYDELKAVLRTREWDENDVLFRLAELKSELELMLAVTK